jgi:hypothetical protein
MSKRNLWGGPGQNMWDNCDLPLWLGNNVVLLCQSCLSEPRRGVRKGFTIRCASGPPHNPTSVCDHDWSIKFYLFYGKIKCPENLNCRTQSIRHLVTCIVQLPSNTAFCVLYRPVCPKSCWLCEPIKGQPTYIWKLSPSPCLVLKMS